MIDHKPICATYYLTNQRFLGVVVRRLHGKPAVCAHKMRPFCLEDKNALGQDPELQWLRAYTSTVLLSPLLWLSLANIL